MKKTIHKHRVVPGHRGGEYTEGNVVEVTITQHAMWHFAEWKLHGRLEDELAWKGLAGMIQKEEIIQTIQRETCRKVGRANKGKSKANSNIGVFGTEKKLAWWDARPEKKRERYEKMRAGVKDPSKGGLRTKREGKGIFSEGIVTFETCSEGGKKGSQITNSTRWEDPDHLELGAHHFNVLKKLQREKGYPSGKENRRKVQ